MKERLYELRKHLLEQVMEQRLGRPATKEDAILFHTEIFRKREYLLYEGFVLGEIRWSLVNDGTEIEYIFHPRKKAITQTEKLIKEILKVTGNDSSSLEFKYQQILVLLQDAKYDRLSD